MSKETFIFISRSGGGKGTQIALFEEFIKETQYDEVFHLESGDRFREFISQDTYASKLAREINDLGQLQPSFLAVWAWTQELVWGLKEDNILMIDGTPRKLNEAKLLDEAFSFYNREHVKVIVIDVSRNWAIDRMKERKRADDKDFESRKKRLDWYDSDVVPVIDFFEKSENYDVIRVNGEQTIKEVHDEILNKLGYDKTKK
jgi:adenylate kinase family enzyme